MSVFTDLGNVVEDKVMLVLCRTQGERICIGDDIQITLVTVRHGIVRLGLEVPDDVTILRKEVRQKMSKTIDDVLIEPKSTGR